MQVKKTVLTTYNDKINLPNSDYVLPFLLENAAVNGRIINLSASVNAILNKHQYPYSISLLLSELMIFATMLGAGLKTSGIVSVELRCTNGLVKFLIADYSYGGKLRAYANFDDNIDRQKEIEFSKLVTAGYITITLDLGENFERYQGIVELKGNSLNEAISEYMQSSQQLETITKIIVSSTEDSANQSWLANGILLQQLPNEVKLSSHDIADEWHKLKLYIDTITDNELKMTDNSAVELLQNLFHEDQIKIFESINIEHQCRCSRERMQNILSGLTLAEQQEIINEQGHIEITCQFCNHKEYFN